MRNLPLTLTRLLGRCSVQVLLLLVGFNTPVPATPAEAHASFTEDGGWCWFSDPRAVSREGRTYSGWVTENGSVQAACVDHATGRVTTFTLHERYERDDHDNPSFLFLPDGRLMAFYTRHGTREEINARVTERPGDITAWAPEVAITPPDASPKTSGITYSHPFLLSNETNALYVFWRGRSFKPTLAKSMDLGKTWSAAQPVFSQAGLPKGNRPYAKYASNGKDRIHLLFTDGHPRNEAQNSVYYACYRAGAFYKADGARMGGLNDLPIRPEQADRVYDATVTGARAWIWESRLMTRTARWWFTPGTPARRTIAIITPDGPAPGGSTRNSVPPANGSPRRQGARPSANHTTRAAWPSTRPTRPLFT